MNDQYPQRQVDWRERDEERRRERAELEELCAEHRLPLPWGPYRAAVVTCFRCGVRTVVYTWVHHEVRSGRVPPAPCPRTLKQRRTRQSGGMLYWVNTCVRCKVPQGDNYLYDEPGSAGPPPFRFTWRDPLPQVPGGPLPEFDRPWRSTPLGPAATGEQLYRRLVLGRRG